MSTIKPKPFALRYRRANGRAARSCFDTSARTEWVIHANARRANFTSHVFVLYPSIETLHLAFRFGAGPYEPPSVVGVLRAIFGN
jgi:hypothetical protein